MFPAFHALALSKMGLLFSKLNFEAANKTSSSRSQSEKIYIMPTEQTRSGAFTSFQNTGKPGIPKKCNLS